MAQLHSIHIGVNTVDPAHYGTDAPLRGCENDARDMSALAQAMGYTPQVFLTREATAARLLGAIGALKRKLVAGDTMLLTLACHGAQLKDVTGDEHDARDETWCLYDRMVIDDEAFTAFSGFKEGVRIFVLSDSCHSGSSVRKLAAAMDRDGLGELDVPSKTFRCITPFLDTKVFNRFLPQYEKIKATTFEGAIARDGGPDVVLISGCQDNQTSADLPTNGFFTSHLKTVWNGGKFNGDYRAFHREITNSMNTQTQVPNLFPYGPTVNALLGERPFGPAKPGRTPAKAKARPEENSKTNGNGGTHMYDIGLHPTVINIMRNGNGRATQKDRIIGPDFDRAFEGGCFVKFDRAVLNGKSDDEILQFFTDVIGPEICSNYFVARDAFSGVAPRGGSISCSASTSGGGHVSCTGTWNF